MKLNLQWVEIEILYQLSLGLEHREIAIKLKSPISTIHHRIEVLRDKFGVKNTTHMVALALRHGIIK